MSEHEMTEQTRIALQNYDAMIRGRGLDDVALDWWSGTLVYGDGGAVIEVLLDPGFTEGPATVQAEIAAAQREWEQSEEAERQRTSSEADDLRGSNPWG